MHSKIRKLGRLIKFRYLHRGDPFMSKTTLYLKTGGTEKQEEHAFIKSNKQAGKVENSRIAKHFLQDELVELCEFM